MDKSPLKSALAIRSIALGVARTTSFVTDSAARTAHCLGSEGSNGEGSRDDDIASGEHRDTDGVFGHCG